MKQTKPIKKIGRRGRMNAAANKAGDKVIAKAGIEWCELQLDGDCLGRFLLQRVHRKKRRFCDADELAIFCLGCQNCHSTVEMYKPEAMFESVNDAINRRNH